jgi:hypothetical protein
MRVSQHFKKRSQERGVKVKSLKGFTITPMNSKEYNKKKNGQPYIKRGRKGNVEVIISEHGNIITVYKI